MGNLTLRDVFLELITKEIDNKDRIKHDEFGISVCDIKCYDAKKEFDVWCDSEMNLIINTDEESMKDSFYNKLYHENLFVYDNLIMLNLRPYIIKAQYIKLNEKLNENLPVKNIKEKVNKI